MHVMSIQRMPQYLKTWTVLMINRHCHKDITTYTLQQKTESLFNKTASTIGLKLNIKKTQVLYKNTSTNNSTKVNRKQLEEGLESVFLGNSWLLPPEDHHKDIWSKPSLCHAQARLETHLVSAVTSKSWPSLSRATSISILLHGSKCITTEWKLVKWVLEVHPQNLLAKYHHKWRQNGSGMSTIVSIQAQHWWGLVCQSALFPEQHYSGHIRERETEGNQKETWTVHRQTWTEEDWSLDGPKSSSWSTSCPLQSSHVPKRKNKQTKDGSNLIHSLNNP